MSYYYVGLLALVVLALLVRHIVRSLQSDRIPSGGYRYNARFDL